MSESASKAWTQRERAETLVAAIREAGGPEGAAISAVKRHVDERHADYPWHEPWHAEVRGAVLADRIQRGTVSFPESNAAPLTPATPARPLAGLGFDPQEIERARIFVATLGNGSVDDSRDVLEFLLEFGNLTDLGSAIETWGELLEAVRGDEQAAQKVLAIVASRLGVPGFPRLAMDTTSTGIAEAA